MTRARLLGRLGGSVIAAVLLVASGARAAEPTKPDYLPYAGFTAADTGEHIALKQAYNRVVQRYNQALYDYLVTLEQHDWLVAVHNRSSDPAERQKARHDARPLRTKLDELRRAVTARAAAVDQAARRASEVGVTVR